MEFVSLERDLEGPVLFSGVWHAMSPDPVLVERLNQHGQSHLLRWWGELNEEEQARLASEIGSIDFDQLDRLIAELVRDDAATVPPADRVQPIEVVRLPQTDGERVVRRRAGGMGADALAAGEVGVILVAGGSGTRLGYEGPKGTFPIGPVSSASLFQIHAEKIVALAAPPRADDPALHHDQPRKPRGDDRFLREAMAGSAWSTSGFSFRGRCRPSIGRPGRSCWRRRTVLHSRPTATAARWPPWPPRGRAGRPVAWTRCASRACGRSSTFRWTIPWSGSPNRRSSACTARPTPRCRSRSSSGSRPTRSWAWS